jgi:hypothetical protein
MRLAENAYAIGPSFHDWEREREDLEDMKREAREHAFNKEFYWWRINLYCDKERDKEKEKILETMNIVMNNIYCNDKDCARFEHALFTWYCSSDNQEARNSMYELLDKYIRAVIRKEWEHEQEAA